MNNKNNNKKNWTNPEVVLEHFNKLYIYLTNILKNKNKKKSINTEKLMILYNGFYSTYIFLLQKKLITPDLIAKREAIDKLSNENMPSINKLSNKNMPSIKKF